jgi:hypothetical protein
MLTMLTTLDEVDDVDDVDQEYDNGVGYDDDHDR